MSVFVKPLFSAVLCGRGGIYKLRAVFQHFTCDDARRAFDTNIIATAIAVVFAVLVYAIAMFLVGGIAKSDVKMLPKGEKIAKTLAKYGFLE